MQVLEVLWDEHEDGRWSMCLTLVSISESTELSGLPQQAIVHQSGVESVLPETERRRDAEPEFGYGARLYQQSGRQLWELSVEPAV